MFLLPLQYFWHLYAVTVCFNLWLPNYLIAFSFQNVSKFMHSLFFRSINENKLFSKQVRRTANRPIYDKSCISDMYILKGFAFFLYVMHEYERIILNAPCSMPNYHFRSFLVTILCSWFFKFVLLKSVATSIWCFTSISHMVLWYLFLAFMTVLRDFLHNCCHLLAYIMTILVPQTMCCVVMCQTELHLINYP